MIGYGGGRKSLIQASLGSAMKQVGPPCFEQIRALRLIGSLKPLRVLFNKRLTLLSHTKLYDHFLFNFLDSTNT
jgi:hypothetical protein